MKRLEAYRRSACDGPVNCIATCAYVCCVGMVLIAALGLTGAAWWQIWIVLRYWVDTSDILITIALYSVFLLVTWLGVGLITALLLIKETPRDQALPLGLLARWWGVCLALVPVWPGLVALTAYVWGDANFTMFVGSMGLLIQFSVCVAVAAVIACPQKTALEKEPHHSEDAA